MAGFAKVVENVAGEEKIDQDTYPRLAHSARGISRLGDCLERNTRLSL